MMATKANFRLLITATILVIVTVVNGQDRDWFTEEGVVNGPGIKKLLSSIRERDTARDKSGMSPTTQGPKFKMIGINTIGIPKSNSPETRVTKITLGLDASDQMTGAELIGFYNQKIGEYERWNMPLSNYRLEDGVLVVDSYYTLTPAVQDLNKYPPPVLSVS